MALHAPVISIVVWKEDALLSAMFKPLYSSTNQQLFKNNFCNQSSPYDNYGQFLLQMEAIVYLPQNQHFSRWAKMNGTQRRAHVSLWRNVLYA